MKITPKLQVVYRKVEDLVPYEKNSRTHSDEQIEKIAASIKEFGWTSPILIDEDQGIIAGHGRLEAAKRLGMEEVPTIELTGLSEPQKRAIIIMDNKLALDAGWDESLLKEEIDWLVSHNYEVELTGFNEDEIKDLLSYETELETAEEPEDEEEEPEELADGVVTNVPTVVKTKPKEVWILGAHRLMCGDATDEGDVAKLMGGAERRSTLPIRRITYRTRVKQRMP